MQFQGFSLVAHHTLKNPSEYAGVYKSEDLIRQSTIQTELKAQVFLNEEYISVLDNLKTKHDHPSSWNISSIKISPKIIFIQMKGNFLNSLLTSMTI